MFKTHIRTLFLTPQQLDQQSPVKIDEWMDINSDRIREADTDLNSTKKFLKIGLNNFLFVDSNGRIWFKGNSAYYPYHFEMGNKLIGYRITEKASN